MRSRQVLRDNRGYLWLAAGLFLLGLVIGLLFSHAISAYVADSLKHLQEVAKQTKAKNDAGYTSLVIFWNNLRAAALMIAGGSVVMVYTVGALLINGMMIGVVLSQVGAHVSTWQLVVYGLLPHGIFELPAIVIASAFGLKLGRVVLIPLPGNTRTNSVLHVLREVWSISWVVLVLLVVAAGVEGTVTPMLIHTFIRK